MNLCRSPDLPGQTHCGPPFLTMGLMDDVPN
jgi:hypothetical protein